MTPASTQEENGYKLVTLSEKLISSPSLNRFERVKEQEGKKSTCSNTPFPVSFLPCRRVLDGLRLIHDTKLDGPENRMHPSEDKNESTDPFVKKVEVLVRNAGNQAENVVSCRKHKNEWNKSECETT